jgi:hypothetical protein
MNLVTASEVAQKRKVTKQSITRLARQYKINTKTRLGWIFSPEEASKLSSLVKPVGRPSNKKK